MFENIPNEANEKINWKWRNILLKKEMIMKSLIILCPECWRWRNAIVRQTASSYDDYSVPGRRPVMLIIVYCSTWWEEVGMTAEEEYLTEERWWEAWKTLWGEWPLLKPLCWCDEWPFCSIILRGRKEMTEEVMMTLWRREQRKWWMIWRNDLWNDEIDIWYIPNWYAWRPSVWWLREMTESQLWYMMKYCEEEIQYKMTIDTSDPLMEYNSMTNMLYSEEKCHDEPCILMKESLSDIPILKLKKMKKGYEEIDR